MKIINFDKRDNNRNFINTRTMMLQIEHENVCMRKLKSDQNYNMEGRGNF